ncbi:hypothetical protein V6615_08670 [Oscillospiraceae bacterium PP1C4]
MDATAKKMSKIIDELFFFFFSVGSDDIKLDVKKKKEGYELQLESNYDPSQYKKVADLDKFLNVTKKNEGLEEFFWQLAGVSTLGQDSELHLIGQMIDRVKLDIRENMVKMVLFKKLD